MAERSARRRKSSKSVEELKKEISDREERQRREKESRKPSGAAADPSTHFKKRSLDAIERHRENVKKYEQEKAKRASRPSGYGYSQYLSKGSSSSSGFNPRSVREEILVDYLLDEGFASDEKSAQAIASVMSEEWIQSIVESETEV